MNQSTGKEFFELLQDDNVNEDYRDLLILHLTAFGLLMIAGVISSLVTRHAIHYGKFGQPSKKTAPADDKSRKIWRLTCFDILVRVVAAFNFLASLMYCASLIRGAALNGHANSGIIVFTTLYLLVALVMATYQLALVFRRSNTKQWWLAFRAMTGAHLFVAYITFWIWLILISLVGNPDDTRFTDGFWSAVSTLTLNRSSLVYTHLSLYLLYLFDSGLRMYYAKLRKEGRQPRVFRPKKKKKGQASRGSLTAPDAKSEAKDDNKKANGAVTAEVKVEIKTTDTKKDAKAPAS
jgi:hypothetical protein